MDSPNLSRRSLLQAIATVIAAGVTPIGWAEAAAAVEQAHAVTHKAGDATISFLTAAEAVDVEAIAAQIVPTDDSPGAREAGAVRFIDRALDTFFSQLASDYRAQLATFQAGYRERYPAANHAAESVVIYSLQRPGAPGLTSGVPVVPLRTENTTASTSIGGAP